MYSAHSQSIITPFKLLHDPAIFRSKIFPFTAVAKEPSFIVKINSEAYNEIVITELESNIREKIKYIEALVPGINNCSLAQKEKIALCLDIFRFPKGSVLCYEGVFSDILQIVLEGEVSMIKNNFGRRKVITKLGKGSFLSENTVINGKPAEFTCVVSSDRAKIGKFKNSDVKNHFPTHIFGLLKDVYSVKEKFHDKILKLSNLGISASLPSKTFPLASPKALTSIGNITLRQNFNFIGNDIKPACKHELERLRDSSPLRIQKFLIRNKD